MCQSFENKTATILGSTNAKSLMFLALDIERLSIRGQTLLF